MSGTQIKDRLSENEVVIVMRLPQASGAESRDDRPMLLTVGIPDQEVVILSGFFRDRERLINEACARYVGILAGSGDEPLSIESDVVTEKGSSNDDRFVYSDDDF